jgi:hypothetical protein
MSSAVSPTKTPNGQEATAVGTTAPAVPEQGSTLLAGAPGPTEPALLPGDPAAGAGAVTGTWQTNVTVDALFGVDEVRNAWIRVVNVGWKKILNTSDGSFTALQTLAAQAKQTGRPISFREEADGMIHEIYLW